MFDFLCTHARTYSFAEVSCGDISALFVLRVAASSTSVDGHTWWFIEYVGGSPKLPAHVDTHFPGNALCLPPFRLYACTRQVGSQRSQPLNPMYRYIWCLPVMCIIQSIHWEQRGYLLTGRDHWLHRRIFQNNLVFVNFQSLNHLSWRAKHIWGSYRSA